MINDDLIIKFYDCATIQRWNDHVRPVEFTELDKQAHKMIIAYVLAKFEETYSSNKINWIKLIEGGIFELLQRAVLTDIKSPVFHQMMKRNKEDIDQFVIDKITADCFNKNKKSAFIKNLADYFYDREYAKREKRILKAAHYLASNWEFKIIYNVAPFIYGVEATKNLIEQEIEDHYDLVGVQRIMLGKKSYGFIDLCGQLRFQSRWAQSPRIPRTSVLGHMMVVASIAYLCSVEIQACPKRIFNNFFSGLFHDLPEVLTRDIISPVKKSVVGLEKWLTSYEKRQIDEKLLPLLPQEWYHEMKYFMIDGFSNKIKDKIIDKPIPPKYNHDSYSPLDGVLIKGCDDLAAFIEVVISMNHGVKSHHLEEGFNGLMEKYKTRPTYQGIDFKKIFIEFSKRYPKQ